VDVRVALRAPLVPIDGQTPLIAPQRFGFLDGRIPQRQPGLRRHGGERMRVRARQRQPPVRLARIVVFQKEDGRISGLALRCTAQAALVRVHGLRFGRIAGAIAHISERQRSQKNEKNAHS